MPYIIALTCSGTNTEYTFSGEKCPAVCGLPDERCTQVDREGCHCQTGTIRDGATGCLAQEACGCSDPQDGTYYQVKISQGLFIAIMLRDKILYATDLQRELSALCLCNTA